MNIGTSSLANWDGSQSMGSKAGSSYRTLLPSSSVSQISDAIDTRLGTIIDAWHMEDLNPTHRFSSNFASSQSLETSFTQATSHASSYSQYTSLSRSSSSMGALGPPINQIPIFNRDKVQPISAHMSVARMIPSWEQGYRGSLLSGQQPSMPLSTTPYSSPTRSPFLLPNTPPIFPDPIETLFTPPSTTLPVDSLFTPPSSPDHAQSSMKAQHHKRIVYRMSHVSVPCFPKYLTRAHYLKWPETDLTSSSTTYMPPSSKESRERYLDLQTTLTDSMNQAYANNYTSSYTSLSEHGDVMRVGRTKKFDLRHAVNCLAGSDFEDELEDGDYELSYGLGERNVGFTMPRRRGESSMIPSKRKRKRLSINSCDVDYDGTQADIASSRSLEKKTARSTTKTPAKTTPPRTPAEFSLSLPEGYHDHNKLSRKIATSPSSNIKTDLLRGNSRFAVATDLPLSWVSHGQDGYSYHAIMLNTRFARKSTISGRWGTPNALDKKSIRTKEQAVGRNSSWTICSPRLQSANPDEEEILTHGLRPASKASSMHVTGSRSSSISHRRSTFTSAMSSTNRLKERSVSTHSIPPSPSTSENIPRPEETNSTPDRLLSDKGKAKQEVAFVPSMNTREEYPSSFQDVTREGQTHPFVYLIPQHQGGSDMFRHARFPRYSPIRGHPHPHSPITRDEAFLFSRPLSPLNQTPTTTKPPPIQEYLGLDDRLEGYDVPISDSQLNLAIGDLEFNQALTIDLPNPAVRRDEQEGRGTVDPSVFVLRQDTPDSPETRVHGDKNKDLDVPRTPPQPVFYEGSKLPPRSVTRVVSVRVRPPSISDTPISTPAHEEGNNASMATEIRRAEDEDPVIVAAPSSHHGSFHFISCSSRMDDVCNFSGFSEGEIYDNASSISDDKEEVNTDDSLSKPEARDFERGPYADIYDMMPSKETVSLAGNRRGKLWALGNEDLFCHQCRGRSSKVHVSCDNYECTKHFCIKCLVTRYEDGTFSFLKTVQAFECPVCRDYCTCDKCSTRRGETYVPLRQARFGHGEESSHHKGRTSERQQLGGKTNLPSIQATDTANAPLQYWGPIYDLECTHPIAKCFVPNGNRDDQVLAQPLTRPRRRKKVKKRVMFIGNLQPGWKEPSRPSPVNTDTRKRFYVGRPPPPIVPNGDSPGLLRDVSPLTDLESEDEEGSFGNFWYSDSNDEATTSDDQDISRDQFEKDKLFLSRRSKERNPEPPYDANGLPTSLDEHMVANTIQSAFAAIGIESHCVL
ncbi:hypothetical protein E1B28_006065 [Marasmius oreades]|uniref:Zinc-finger domain-containing protein n=1 Tax=Marasmius oreades TaxID=181124 RepID=A0A9P7UV79_9AGAR|nr:uncharacterized protein E1B28_006065 [Marasmius oreades]KAG7095298.1 hypothetical protein E1B28_006065 [Marasmius oreades]